MSRLDSFIRRMTAQRDLIDHIARQADLLPGPIVELGLGNGRTYSHFRERFPDRRILCFDRALNANPASIPPEGDLILGEIAETGPQLAGMDAAVVHSDIGFGDPTRDAPMMAWLPALVASLCAPGALAMSGAPLSHPDLIAQPLPGTIAPERYFFYRRA
jgi:trans-aconitate methyltransferase